MTCAALLKRCRLAGIHLAATPGGVAFEAPPGAMTADLRAAIAGRRAELLAVLAGHFYAAALAMTEAETNADGRAELRYRFEERAGIVEYDGGMGRADAERLAYREIAEGGE